MKFFDIAFSPMKSQNFFTRQLLPTFEQNLTKIRFVFELIVL